MQALALLLALAPGSEVVRDWLVLAPTDKAGRRPFSPSAVFAKHLAAPGLAAPKEGDALTGELGEEQRWTTAQAGEDGMLGGKVAWAYARVESKERRVVMAKLGGAARLFVNGAGYVGDAYSYGFGGVPVVLAQGANDVYVGGVRGSFRLELADVAAPVVAGSWDHLVPDLVRGTSAPIPSVGVLAFNASDAAHEIAVEALDGVVATNAERWRDAQLVHPGAAWRFSVPVDAALPDAAAKTRTVSVALAKGGAGVRERVEVPVREPGEARRVGFTSAIDGSLQAYSLVPQRAADVKPYLPVLLSLHGASVDALGQARSYAAKDHVSIVCPTNRRPYGFDWQDWGRTDAYEALDDFLAAMRVRVLAQFHANPPSPSRVETYDAVDTRRRAHVVLTGHSMGGHGTWSLAANDPDAFDAIGPSAGWASFDSYGGRPDGALKSIWRGADFASQTEDLATNLVQLPAFVLHGTADDNVPASEARDMIALLEKLGAKPRSHFQEGAGHWWDGDLSAGADCVDHPDIFALFDAPDATDELAFDWTSADPGVDSRHRWLEVLQPLVYGRPFRVRVTRGEDRRTLQLETDNVRCLRFARIAARLRASIDGHDVGPGWPTDQCWELTTDGWTRRAERPRGKSPEQCGPFKRAFGNRFVLVFGTSGNDDEDRELYARARHDQQAWWYRANATARLVSDVEFLREGFRGRNVIVYGNRDTNAAWAKLFLDGPFDARRGELRLGDATWKGDDLGAVVVRPRGDDVVGLVGAFADTGPRGSRLGYALAPFTSGVGYPDYALYSSAILSSGDGGVLATGWFDAGWRLDAKQYVKPD